MYFLARLYRFFIPHYQRMHSTRFKTHLKPVDLCTEKCPECNGIGKIEDWVDAKGILTLGVNGTPTGIVYTCSKCNGSGYI